MAIGYIDIYGDVYCKSCVMRDDEIIIESDTEERPLADADECCNCGEEL